MDEAPRDSRAEDGHRHGEGDEEGERHVERSGGEWARAVIEKDGLEMC